MIDAVDDVHSAGKCSESGSASDEAEGCAKLYEDILRLCNEGQQPPNIFPLPLPAKPMKSDSPSPRIRRRFEKRLIFWKVATRLVHTLNAISHGDLRCTHQLAQRAPSSL